VGNYFPIFEPSGITKHLITGPSGISVFCFPSKPHQVSRKQNSPFPLRSVILMAGAKGNISKNGERNTKKKASFKEFSKYDYLFNISL